MILSLLLKLLATILSNGYLINIIIRYNLIFIITFFIWTHRKVTHKLNLSNMKKV
jgi:hypothetical protein